MVDTMKEDKSQAAGIAAVLAIIITIALIVVGIIIGIVPITLGVGGEVEFTLIGLAVIAGTVIGNGLLALVTLLVIYSLLAVVLGILLGATRGLSEGFRNGYDRTKP